MSTKLSQNSKMIIFFLSMCLKIRQTQTHARLSATLQKQDNAIRNSNLVVSATFF